MGRTPSGSLTIETLADGTQSVPSSLSASTAAASTRRSTSVAAVGAAAAAAGRSAPRRSSSRTSWHASAPASGASEPRSSPSRRPTAMPTFHVYASAWLESKIAGVLGDRPIDTNTENDYRWRLGRHLLPFFGEYRLDEIDAQLCSGVQGAQAARGGRAARGDRRRSRPARRERAAPAPARTGVDPQARSTAWPRSSTRRSRTSTSTATRREGRRMRVKVPKPARTFLEMDELVALTDAAAEQDARQADGAQRRPGRSATARRRPSPARWARGMRPSDIAAELGLSKATVSYHLRRLGAEGPGDLRRPPRDRRDARRLRHARQRALRPPHPRAASARRDRRALPDPGRQDRGRHPRGAGQPRPRRRARRAPRQPAPRRPLDRARRLSVPEPARRPDEPPARGGDRQRGRRARVRAPRRSAGCRSCRTRRRTRCGAPTSRSRCSPTASTCCG